VLAAFVRRSPRRRRRAPRAPGGSSFDTACASRTTGHAEAWMLPRARGRLGGQSPTRVRRRRSPARACRATHGRRSLVPPTFPLLSQGPFIENPTDEDYANAA
jgi:hypothetical protein